jgi:Hypervirulence associated proteins TUDOR domain
VIHRRKPRTFTVSRGENRRSIRHVERPEPEAILMTRTFSVGDHVTWNSEAGHVSGKIIKVHKKDVQYKGYTHHASEDEPQYEIKSDKSDHVAMHKGSALKKVTD